MEGHNWGRVTSDSLAPTAPTSPGLATAGVRGVYVGYMDGVRMQSGREAGVQKSERAPTLWRGVHCWEVGGQGSGLVTKVLGCHGRTLKGFKGRQVIRSEFVDTLSRRLPGGGDTEGGSLERRLWGCPSEKVQVRWSSPRGRPLMNSRDQAW